MFDESARGSSLLFRPYTVEVTSGDRKSVAVAIESLPKGTEVFVANLPTDTSADLVDACKQLSAAGLSPVPHIVARNIPDEPTLKNLLRELAAQADVKSALCLAGDRDKPVGALSDSLQLIRTGAFQDAGIGRLFISCYPEGHPRIPDGVIRQARLDKLKAINDAGLEAVLMSQFCFESGPYLSMLREIRSQGITAPVRIGVSGPANVAKLMKYAIACGVGASMRALKEKQGLASMVLFGETPDEIIADVSAAVEQDPSLGEVGIHYFTLGSLKKTLEWLQRHRAEMA
ncbi:MAG: methylenetetrahydrofolate reductase [Hyphomonas sp.]|uniref:methylenetetrahydrofolate reductase n=1 Tax=Hyphomonas sp. TaxID=87 RepID=UPI00181548CB|nr:methylenetetrahydrofolate reductase [Hyphomonas sp.]MBA3066952.1 methylenetetrahydrofolate reductase [Hyphomonas sp.]MBU3921295.1 methylenetetrahydrofolate reductase [Alphaproteobacteria bacterium]MBU4060544.1 methylenetetrahydrofolate reductase [Alphaproteobacteria bacterium]MBU4165812.1 methylenetetrahydrofolate reductase [Alphaproteobacteria bacterium]